MSGEQQICRGCGQPELHKMCPAWGTDAYLLNYVTYGEIQQRYLRWRRWFPQEDVIYHLCRQDKIRLVLDFGTKHGQTEGCYFLNVGPHVTYFYYPADDLLGRDDARLGVMEVVKD